MPSLKEEPDDNHVLHNQRRRVEPGFTGFQIDLFAGALHHADFQVHHAVLRRRR